MLKTIVRSLPAAAAVAALMSGATAFADTAATVSGNVTVQATLTPACEVSSAGATIDFGSIVALASTGNKDGNSGSGFQVACSTGLSPKIYSTTARVMDDGQAHSLPFDLCLAECTGSNGLAATEAGADTLAITQDGDLKTVTLYGRVQAADFKALPAGSYSKTVTVSVDY